MLPTVAHMLETIAEMVDRHPIAGVCVVALLTIVVALVAFTVVVVRLTAPSYIG